MQKPLSFERLQKDMPETVAKVVARARESRSRRFDATTDPSTWTWLLDWSERTPDALPEPMADRSDEQRWDDLRADGAEAYVRERIRRNGLMPSLRLKTGPTSILEMITADGELPSEWVDTFGLKTYAPLPWDGDTITLYQPFNTERPGLAQAAVLAGFTTSSGATVLLMAEGHLDRTMDTLWSVTLQPSRQLAIVGGTQPRQNGEWDVPVGEVITVEDEKWRRLDANEVRQAIGSAPWLRQDSTTARDAMAMLGWPVPPARRGASAPAMNELPADAPVWAVGAARSDEEVLRDKWTPIPMATPAASSSAPMAAATTPGDGTGPVQPSGKKATTVAGSVRTNDPVALREALAASKSSGYQLSDEQLSALLLNAAEKAGAEVMSILIEHGADPTYRTRQGMTLTSTVVRHERIDNLIWLHQNGYANLDEDDGNGNTVFMTAVESHRFVGAQALLDLGASINGTNLFNHTALHQAAQTGNGESVKWLIEHRADPNVENFQGVIAEEMVPNELPEMVDVLADYRFAWDKGETYTLPDNFLASLRNESQHPSMNQDGNAHGGMGGMDLGGGMGVQISGLEGVTVISGDDFQKVLGQHGAEGLATAGQDGTLGAILGAAGARTMGPGEHALPQRDQKISPPRANDAGQAGSDYTVVYRDYDEAIVGPSDYIFAYIGYGSIAGVSAHLVAITPKAVWDAQGCMDDQPHPEIEPLFPSAWQAEDLNEGGSWAFVTPESPEQVIARLRTLGFQEDRVFSAMVRATVDAPEPLDGDLDEPGDAPQAPTPPRPRMR